MSLHIPSAKVNEGIRKSVENATRYLNDALFLHQNGKHQSSVLLSMLSYEEAGKALMLIDYKSKKKKITKTQWRKRFCNHQSKNLHATRTVWRDAGFVSPVPNWDLSVASFTVDWKEVFTYVDYDFRNRKWTSPNLPKSFGIGNAENFSTGSLSQAAGALKCIVLRATEFDKSGRKRALKSGKLFVLTFLFFFLLLLRLRPCSIFY